MTRWQGLADLVQDAVHHGSAAVEKVHQQVARAPLDALARVTPLAPGARWGADRQAGLIAATYATVRVVNAAVGGALRVAIGAMRSDRSERVGGA